MFDFYFNPRTKAILRLVFAGLVTIVLLLLAVNQSNAQVPMPTDFGATRTTAMCSVLRWTPVALNAEHYEVHRSDAAHPSAVIGTALPTATTYQDCTLDPERGTYNYLLRGIPKRGIGIAVGVDAVTGYMEIESSWPSLVRVWGNRIGGMPVGAYCSWHAPVSEDDPISRDCWIPLSNNQLHYHWRPCDAAGCADWIMESHLRCGPIMAGGGCRCSVFPSEPGCVP